LRTNKYILMICMFSCAVNANTSDDALFREISLEDLLNIEVEVVTKSAEKSHLSPAITTVITAEDIKLFGYQNVADVLSFVSGFADNYDLAIHNFGVRGINSGARSGSRTIKFMINGQSISFDATSQHFIDDEFLPLAAIKQIEVIRGPVSALYGANAFLGVVNIVTKDDELLENSISFKTTSTRNGKGNLLGGALSTKLADGQMRGFFNIGNYDRSGVELPRRSPSYKGFEQIESSDDVSKPKSLFVNWLKDLGEGDSELNITAYYQALNVDNVFSDINPLSKFDATRIGLENLVLRVGYETEIQNEMLLRSYVSFSEGGTLDDDRVELGAEQFYLNRRLGYDTLELGAELTLGLDNLGQILVGLDGKKQNHKIETFSRTDRIDGDLTLLNPNRDEELDTLAVFAQYSVDLGEQWRLIAGARVDDDSVIGKHTSSRLGMVGQLWQDTVVKILFGSAFQAPSPELLYRTAVQSGDIIGNPDLKAQTADTFEVSIALPVGDSIYSSLTYFYTKVGELVVFNSDGSNLLAQNSASSETQGIEAEFRLLWQDVNAFLNVSWQDTDRASSEFSLNQLEMRENGELFPEVMANLGVSYFWREPQVQLSLTTRWVGERPASSSNVLIANQLYDLEPYYLTSLTVSTNRWSLFEGHTTTIQLHIHDLFDHRPVNPGFGGIEFPSQGRELMLTFIQEF